MTINKSIQKEKIRFLPILFNLQKASVTSGPNATPTPRLLGDRPFYKIIVHMLCVIESLYNLLKI